jgi:hypothetical protein
VAVTHTILKGSRLVLHAERAKGAPDGIYSAACMTCPEESGRVDSDPGPVAQWVMLHTEQHGPEHSQFLVTTDRHWRVDPVRPPGSMPAEGHSEQTLRLAPVDPAPQVRAHARRRARRPWETAARRAAAHAGDVSGPFVILALITVCTLGGYLLGAGHSTG